MLFLDGVVVFYFCDGGLCRLLGHGVLQFCIRREEFDMSFDCAIFCILLLRCFPYRMTVYFQLFVCGCVVSALPFCRVDGWCGFQCDRVGGGDYRDGEFDDFVE